MPSMPILFLRLEVMKINLDKWLASIRYLFVVFDNVQASLLIIKTNIIHKEYKEYQERTTWAY